MPKLCLLSPASVCENLENSQTNGKIDEIEPRRVSIQNLDANILEKH